MSTGLKQQEEQSTQRKHLVVLGPFIRAEPRPGRTAFDVDPRALVPRQRVLLDNARILKVYRVPVAPFSYNYYVVYETENLDFYKYYLARIPEKAVEVKRMLVPRCRDCGSYRVYGDADELYCTRCMSDRIVDEVVWEEKPLPATRLIEGEGVYVVADEIREYRDLAGSSTVEEVEAIAEGEGKLGNVECKWREFLGYVAKTDYEEGFYVSDTGVYRRYTVPSLNRVFTVKVRDATPEELLRMSEKIESPKVLLYIARKLPREQGEELILKREVYKHVSWRTLSEYGFATERIKAAYVKAGAEQVMKLLSEGRVESAYRIAEELRTLFGYEDDAVRRAEEEYRRYLEEMRRKLEEERKQREMEKRMVIEHLKEKLAEIPVKIEADDTHVRVSLAGWIPQRAFNRYTETCRKLGMRYDPKSKAWWTTLRDIAERIKQPG
ncbi:MAG: hypothetical protein QXM08_03235 [Thermofilaceae archaeon]